MATPAFLKDFGKSRFAGRLASAAIAAYIRLLELTCRVRIEGLEHIRALETTPTGFIMTFWHSRILASPILRRRIRRRFVMLISAHRDGEIIANAVKGFDCDFVRGSTANARKKFKNKGGAGAVIELAKTLRAGDVIGVTPDGPRGPAEEVQEGVVRLARMTGAGIVPFSYDASGARRLKTWDRFMLVRPFSRLVFVVEPPIFVARDAGSEAVETARVAASAALARAEHVAAAIAADKTGADKSSVQDKSGIEEADERS